MNSSQNNGFLIKQWISHNTLISHPQVNARENNVLFNGAMVEPNDVNPTMAQKSEPDHGTKSEPDHRNKSEPDHGKRPKVII